MLMRREDKERSKYSKYKARVDLTKNRTSSERARWGSIGGLHSLACTCVGLRAFSDGASRELSRS